MRDLELTLLSASWFRVTNDDYVNFALKRNESVYCTASQLQQCAGAGVAGVKDPSLVAMHGNDSSSSSADSNDTAQYPPLSGYVINAAPSTVAELCVGGLVCMAFAIVAQAHWSLV